MSDRVRHILSALTILAVALIVWLPTLGWGLPSRDSDKYLFGERRPWTGAEIIALTATTQPTAARGADVDADPILDRSKPVILNDTDAKRAAIVRRYRLMSGQPDEFIQFKALSEMAARPGLAKLDPRLYQYGGFWMYPVGAMVRASMLVGIIQTPPPGTPAMEFYLDHPEAFGRFYVVARFYSWCWGLVAAFAIVWIARRITNSIPLATLAAVAFMLTPVVRTATHEAKPHLAGAALCLCAVIAATKYVETGRRRWMVAAGALCGASMAMVVSMLLSCVVLPMMYWLRSRATKSTRVDSDRASGEDASSIDVRSDPTPQGSAWIAPLASLAIAAIVYVATNPFVLINAIAHPEILRSNLGNSTAMYSARSDGFKAGLDGIVLLLRAFGWGASWAVVGIGAAALLRLRERAGSTAASVLLATVGLFVFLQFLLLAQSKPAEYARFGIIPCAATAIAVASAVATASPRERGLIAAIPLVTALAISLRIAKPLSFDSSRAVTSVVLRQALRLESGVGHARPAVRLNWEPAPWSMPPCDLFVVDLILARLHTPFDRGRPVVFPTNLSGQIGGSRGDENLDWRENRFVLDGLSEAK